MMNADLHCHSTVSDGQLAPAEVAARAHAGGVTLWALTDHDQLGGQREARAMGEALAAVGIPDAYEGALQYVNDPAMISRTHFARCLVDRGYSESISDVFSKYLGDGKPGY